MTCFCLELKSIDRDSVGKLLFDEQFFFKINKIAFAFSNFIVQNET